MHGEKVKLIKTHPVGAELFQADREADGRLYMMKLRKAVLLLTIVKNNK